MEPYIIVCVGKVNIYRDINDAVVFIVFFFPFGQAINLATILGKLKRHSIVMNCLKNTMIKLKRKYWNAKR
jgi:hypothetical protein